MSDLPCCCICGQEITRGPDNKLYCPDHYEVDEHICDSLNPPGWRNDMICASDRRPDPPRVAPSPEAVARERAMMERQQFGKPWMRSGRHG